MSFFGYKTLVEIFAENRDRYSALIQLIETIMRGESALSPGERELIAAYVSILNSCKFCHNTHQEIAINLGIEPELLAKLETDPESFGDRLILPLVKKLTINSARVSQSDIDRLINAGMSQKTVRDVIEVCALFNFMNRFVDGYGIVTPSSEQLRSFAKKINTSGYQASFWE